MGIFGARGAKAAGSFDPSQLSKRERIALFASAISDAGAGLAGRDGDAVSNMQGMMAQRQSLAAESAWKQQFGGLFGSGYQGMGPGADGEPVKPEPRKIPTLRDALPLLLSAPKGVNAGQYADMLDKAGPDVRSNGQFTYDGKDPANAGKFFPTFDKGQAPQFDAQRNVVGVQNLPGAVQSAADMAGAVSGAQEQAKAPYSFPTFQGPDGAPTVVSAATAAALGSNGGVIARGQTRPDAIRAEGRATNDVAQMTAAQNRAASAGRQLSALDNMERLLPDVISGFGAGPRTEAARALAAMGNEKAVKEVSATETFLNQGRVLVADMIKSFGANPTEGERKYAERMSGADAELNPETLKEGIRLQRDRINRDLQDAGKPAAPRPAPATRNQLERGVVYATPKGPMLWTGTGFKPQ